ncbi:MAG: flagellar biosynthetic protein FliR [Myxococcales bacterium]|nr:MAG: flagellar biosynthetic protein FliR [Myxococcales bacterium]
MFLSAFIDHLYPFFLIGTRLTALFVLAPAYGGRLLPPQVKLALVIAVSLALHFGFGIGADLVRPNPDGMIMGILREFAVGAGMGLVLDLIFSSIGFAGSIVAPQMGMAISQLIDPQTESMQPLLSTFMTMVGVVFFLAIDGHLTILRGLVDSYRLVPLGSFVFGGGAMNALLDAGEQMFFIAFRLSAPVLALIMFINVGLAVMARAVPQMNVLVVGFIITIGIGILAMALFFPLAGPYMRDFIESALERMMLFLKTV